MMSDLRQQAAALGLKMPPRDYEPPKGEQSSAPRADIQIKIEKLKTQNSAVAVAPDIPSIVCDRSYNAVPASLQRENGWLAFEVKYNAETKHFDKRPFNPAQGEVTNKPEEAVSFEKALTFVNAREGFVLGLYIEKPYLGIDLDGCRDPKTGVIAEWAWKIIRAVNSYAEISPSGTGVRIIARGVKPGDHCRRGSVEIYSHSRGVTISGVHLDGTPTEVNDTDIAPIYNAMMAGEFIFDAAGKKSGKPLSADGHSTKIQHDGSRVLTNKLTLLMIGNFVADARPFIVSDEGVHNSLEYTSQSEAIQSLLTCLAYKHDGDKETMENEFLTSALYQGIPKWNGNGGGRNKWQERREDELEAAVKFMRNHALTFSKAVSPPDVAASSQANEPSLLTARASDIAPEHQEWLWKNRIPANTLTGLVGEPDKGKGVLSIDLVARLTTGRDFPDGQKNPYGKPVEVLLFIAEDSLKTTVVPRLMAAEADLQKVHLLDSVMLNQADGKKLKKQLALDTDLPAIRAYLHANPEIRLGIVDTITSYTGNANQYKDSEMRRILIPFRDLAEELRVSFITVAHFNKSIGASAMNRTGGSIAITAVPRAVWCCTADPEEQGQYLFLQIKGNLGRKLAGLSYRIKSAFIEIGKKEKEEAPRIVWGEKAVDCTADEVLVKSSDPAERGISRAKKYLQEVLADGKPHLSAKVYEVALCDEDLSGEVVKNARDKLGVQSHQQGRHWYMRLPCKENRNGRTPWVIEAETNPRLLKSTLFTGAAAEAMAAADQARIKVGVKQVHEPEINF